MPAEQTNPLRESGKPLFFKVESRGASEFSVPPIRLGDAVRVCARSLSVMQKEAVVASARTEVVWRLASDEGAYLAGLDEAPCPLSFLGTGMVSAYMNEILALARQRAILIDDIRLVQDNYYTMVGSALKGTMTAGARNIRLTAQIASDADRDMLSRLVRDAVVTSPVNGLVGGSKSSFFTLTHNGRALEPARALSLLSAEPDAEERVAHARPAGGRWEGLVRRVGPSPKLEHTVTFAGGSLSEEQSRLLHLRFVCTLREDGVKRIEQHLYNPHGSIFRFLSDEAKEDGGRGVAPDALTYVSAGIAFCFMTQLGRYAQIAQKKLHRCGIVQDTHFSLGSGASGTDEPGKADPVETHVYLDTGEHDEFARTSLDMGEQTCFLHALCKTALRVDVSVEKHGAALPSAAADSSAPTD